MKFGIWRWAWVGVGVEKMDMLSCLNNAYFQTFICMDNLNQFVALIEFMSNFLQFYTKSGLVTMSNNHYVGLSESNQQHNLGKYVQKVEANRVSSIKEINRYKAGIKDERVHRDYLLQQRVLHEKAKKDRQRGKSTLYGGPYDRRHEHDPNPANNEEDYMSLISSEKASMEEDKDLQEGFLELTISEKTKQLLMDYNAVSKDSIKAGKKSELSSKNSIIQTNNQRLLLKRFANTIIQLESQNSSLFNIVNDFERSNLHLKDENQVLSQKLQIIIDLQAQNAKLAEKLFDIEERSWNVERALLKTEIASVKEENREQAKQIDMLKRLTDVMKTESSTKVAKVIQYAKQLLENERL